MKDVNDRHVSTSAVSTPTRGLGSSGDFDAGIPREVFIHQAPGTPNRRDRNFIMAM